MTEIDRRTFLRRAGATGVVGAGLLLPAPTTPAARRARERDAAFEHGVASGDPLADRVILWTRATPADPGGGPLAVRWTVAEDERLRRVVAKGRAVTSADRDWTVKVDAAGLRPGRRYFYGFTCGDAESPVGRTRTAPAGTVDRVVLAAVSCQTYAGGFYNAHARLAERDDVDLVVCLGDYIYESGGAGVRRHAPAREIRSLGDYRTRYAQYRADPDLQAVHGAHPWALVWDDHESANNSWRDGAGAHDPATEGPWSVRRSVAVQAYREWMPIRWPDPADALRIWRHLPYGDLVDLLMVDTRLYGRNAPATPTGPADDGSNDPSRRMLGAQQEAWLRERLAGSSARWRVLGNQTMISPHHYGGGLPYLPEEVIDAGGLRQGGGNEGSDNWGAYRVERDRVIGALRGRGDNLVLTGDIHSAWGCDVVEDPNTPTRYNPVTGAGSAAVELVCTSITSNNIGDSAPQAAPAASAGIVAGNPNVHYCDLGGHGYTIADVRRDQVRAEWWQVPTVRERARGERLAAAGRVERGTDHLVMG